MLARLARCHYRSDPDVNLGQGARQRQQQTGASVGPMGAVPANAFLCTCRQQPLFLSG
jgi:hypothetical protein